MSKTACDAPERTCDPDTGLCDYCLREWLNRPAPARRWSGREPSTIRSHVTPWFQREPFDSYTGSVFWFPLAFPNLPLINVDPQLEAGHG